MAHVLQQNVQAGRILNPKPLETGIEKMIKQDAYLLEDIILSIMKDYPLGLIHAQLVRRVLETGYVSEENTLSEDVMMITKRMLNKKMIKKNTETRIIKPNFCPQIA